MGARRLSRPHEQSRQRVRPDLPAPVAVYLRVKNRTLGQHIGAKKMLAWGKHPRDTALQSDLHVPTQNKYPLRVRCAMKAAAKTHRAVA